jgi:DNA repair exonuclease SbcCD ATPase subunit
MNLRTLILVLISVPSSLSQTLAEDPVRKAELARIEKEVVVQKKAAENKVADLTPKLKSLDDMVTQKEKTLREHIRRGRVTQNIENGLAKLRAEQEELTKRFTDRQHSQLKRLNELEQERRRLVKKFPEPGDPAYVEVEGKLFTQDEWDLEKTKYPRTVAEEYIQELLRLGIVRSAKYTKTTQHAMSQDRGSDGLPVHDFLNLNYSVQYVSKGGVLNERNVWVTVVTIDGEHWLVSQMMKELEVLGGLP